MQNFYAKITTNEGHEWHCLVPAENVEAAREVLTNTVEYEFKGSAEYEVFSLRTPSNGVIYLGTSHTTTKMEDISQLITKL